MTNVDGQFNLDVPSDAVLEVSCLGYVTQEVAVAGKSQLNVVLAEDTELLEEVVVVGYGTTKKENLTGAVSVVSSDAAGNHSDGVAVGSLRADDVKVTIKGFVAWNDNPNKKFIYQDKVPVTGNYHGTEGTISAQAKALGWDESIWDLSADTPKLK